MYHRRRKLDINRLYTLNFVLAVILVTRCEATDGQYRATRGLTLSKFYLFLYKQFNKHKHCPGNLKYYCYCCFNKIYYTSFA